MSQPTSEPAQPTVPSADGNTEILSTGGSGPVPAAGSAGRRRGLAIGAGVLAVALVGGGAALTASRLGGGGAQPDQVVPASAIAFAAVDLDPSSGQKFEAVRFLRKFPSTKDRLGKGEDLRKALFESLKTETDVAGNWSNDVEPWLGERAAMAVLPPAADGEDPVALAVLAVTDEGKARAGLAKVAGGKAACEVADGFAVCAREAASARKAVADAAKNPLSKAAAYTADLAALGERGIARAWVDLGRIKDAAPSSGIDPLGLAGAQMRGRAAFALRFDGPSLALTGSIVGAGLPKLSGAASLDALPADTLGAYAFTGADDLVKFTFDQVRRAAQAQNAMAEFDDQLAQVQRQYSVAVPGDIQKAVGKRVAVAFGGAGGGAPKIAVRLSGDRATIDKLLAAVERAGGGPLKIGRAPAGSDTVLASTQPYADAVARGSGLGAQKAFRTAVPDAKGAQAVLYADVSRIMGEFAGQLGLSSDDRADLDPLASLGMIVRQDGDRIRYDVRLTTK